MCYRRWWINWSAELWCIEPFWKPPCSHLCALQLSFMSSHAAYVCCWNGWTECWNWAIHSTFPPFLLEEANLSSQEQIHFLTVSESLTSQTSWFLRRLEMGDEGMRVFFYLGNLIVMAWTQEWAMIHRSVAARIPDYVTEERPIFGCGAQILPPQGRSVRTQTDISLATTHPVSPLGRLHMSQLSKWFVVCFLIPRGTSALRSPFPIWFTATWFARAVVLGWPRFVWWDDTCRIRDNRCFCRAQWRAEPVLKHVTLL